MSMKELGVVGRNVGQRDLESHARGQTTYYEDVHYPRMLHLRMHRSAEPHARIVRVDTSAAQASPGVVCVLTHEDLPGKKVWNGLAAVGVGPEDEPVLAFDKVRWRGEPIVAVLGESAEAARAGAARVAVEYDPLPGVFDVEEAIAGSAPALTAHWPNNHYIYPDDHAASQIRFGDVEEAFAGADHVVEGPLPDQPHRAGADGDQRLHRQARRRRAHHRAHQHAGRPLRPRQHRRHSRHRAGQAALRGRHGGRRFRGQGGCGGGADLGTRRHADRTPGQVQVHAGGGDAGVPPPAPPGGSTSRTG